MELPSGFEVRFDRWTVREAAAGFVPRSPFKAPTARLFDTASSTYESFARAREVIIAGRSPIYEEAPDGRSILDRILRECKAAREKEAEAAGEFASDTIGVEFFAALFSPERASGFSVVDAANLSDAVSGSCRHLTESTFKGIGSGFGVHEFGISGIVLTFAAGTSAELAIGPIAKKCGIISRALTFGGIVLGVVTGNHVLVIACTKKLLIGQAERVLAKSVAEFLQGSGTDAESGASKLPTSIQIPSHTLAVTSEKLPVALGQDVEQWVRRLASQRGND